MLEDRLLVWKLKHGSKDALRCVYEKYKNDLLSLAIALCNNRDVAEDVVQDVFVSFAQIARKLQLRTSLKGYLLTSIANRARNMHQAGRRQMAKLENIEPPASTAAGPAQSAFSAEQSKRISRALAELPTQQREAVILHLQHNMRFKEIAQLLGASANTIKSRYRYALNKLRSTLNSEVKK